MSLMDLERSYENEGSPYYDEDLGDSFRNHDDQDVPVRIRRPRPPMVVSSMTLHERAIHAIESADWDACVDLVATDPNIAVMKLPDHNGKNLLHFIASGENEVPDKTVLKIISNKPEALGLIDGGGNLPLHMAARNPQRTGMVRLFVQGFRAGVATKNANGELPLHVTAELGSGSEEIVKVLCDAYPKGIQVGDKIGRLPIHAACCNKNASVDVVRTLLSHHYNLRVNACKLDKEGNSPIHLAIKARTSLDVIAAFHDADESFIRSFLQPDNIGNLPIHSALKKDIDPQLIMLIINAAPFSGAVASCTSVMPICLATKHRFPEEVITALLEVDMPIELSMKNDVVKRQHGHSWWHIVVECHDRYLKTIKDVISKATSSQVVALARSLGPDNVTRIADVASPAAKELFSGHLRFFSRYEILTTDSYENEDGVETFKAIDYGNGALSFDDALEGGQFSSVRPKTNYGSDDSGNEEDFQGNEGKAERREVILRIFALREQFLSEANVRSTYRLSSKFVEEILNTHHSKEYQHILKKGNLFCIAYEKPDHTLAQVFSKTPAGTRSEKWIKKSSVVLKQIGSAIRHVHQHGLIHGSIDPNTVAKYGERWKLTDLSSVVPHGRAMNGAIRQCIPPESIVGTKSDSQDNFQREERKTFEPVSILKAPNYGGSPVQSASSKVTFDSEVKNQKKALEKNKERNSDREKKRSGLGAFFSGKKDKDKDKDKFNYISESEPESEVDEVLLREKDIEIQRLRTLVEEGHKKVFQSVTQSSGVTSRVQCTFAPERCIASPTWDAWAFGLLMVQLIIGKSPLLPNFDLSEGALLANLFMFDMDELRQLCTQVKRVAGQNAADLVSKLLRPPPEERPSTISKVLQHPYFEIRGHTPIHRGRPHASPVQEDDDEKVAETMHTSYASEPEKLPATAPRTFSQRDRNQDKSKFW
eukprot:CAMPEP_0113297770 /NCGR_PEP_ID=MMETSP0010_2-20120614/492_1 /TAXON_ID=216773 ORGANISM="Corethron hystrix, Strain 308" /NCGR_SAMPLE_ID=MMETSP0010_2 /ASSEMBLY_ACC=CAM_ASM_000155 /LENGTH=934 /DNA_ID=CAMNT_0000150711 /DNA_START=211 /DNA_END=3012 /DNA_ORIENTATION=- /assembly_acc=CAM_ASM_000155